MKLVPCLAVLLASLACGKKDSNDDDDGKDGTPSTGPVGEVSDTSEAGVTEFLKAASYREWATKQAAPIDSVSAHESKTQTYFDDAAAAAAKAGEARFPKGSVIVKEIFEADGVTLRGKALMAKVADAAGGGAWLWFEGFLPDYDDPYYGVGHTTCTGCHEAGTDFVRTAVP
jgi:hypothetical protein